MLFVPLSCVRRYRVGGEFLRHFLNGKLVFGQGKLGHICFLFLAMAAAVDSVSRYSSNMLPDATFARSIRRDTNDALVDMTADPTKSCRKRVVFMHGGLVAQDPLGK
jgi:hypothetical protein